MANKEAPIQSRTMVQATLDDGRTLVALNEIFVGVRTHQSARYRLRIDGCEERQSSSGIIVNTGTGATGWARSIHRERSSTLRLPDPMEPRLTFFVREAFPSVSSATELTEGVLGGAEFLEVVSEAGEAGVIFGDGIEEDRLNFDWGAAARIEVAAMRLNLIPA